MPKCHILGQACPEFHHQHSILSLPKGFCLIIANLHQSTSPDPAPSSAKAATPVGFFFFPPQFMATQSFQLLRPQILESSDSSLAVTPHIWSICKSRWLYLQHGARSDSSYDFHPNHLSLKYCCCSGLRQKAPSSVASLLPSLSAHPKSILNTAAARVILLKSVRSCHTSAQYLSLFLTLHLPSLFEILSATTVVPQNLQGIGSRTLRGYENPRMLKFLVL